MISSKEEMKDFLTFLSDHISLRNIHLEEQDDMILLN